MNIGDRIKKLRIAANMTGEKLGQLFDTDHHQIHAGKSGGYGKQTISSWESGRNDVTAPQIERLCEIFGVSADYLILGIKNKNLGNVTDEAIEVAMKFDQLLFENKKNVMNSIDFILMGQPPEKKQANGG